MSRRVLVTGGLGYLGGRIAQGLVSDPDIDLVIVTRQRIPTRPSWLPRGEIRQVDFEDNSAWVEVCSGVDQLVHLVSPNAADCGLDPEAAIRVNVIGTLRVLQAAIEARVNRFVYMSSAHVYGTLSNLITEKVLPVPRHPYAITKQTAEDFVLAAHDAGKIESVVMRLSNSYGMPTHSDINAWMLLVNDLCRQAVTQRMMRLRSSGVQVRDFIPLGDVVRAVEHVLRLSAESLGDGLFNLGGDDCVSIRLMADRVADRCEAILGYHPEIQHPDPFPGEQAQPLDYSSEKLKATGFTPERKIQQEIDDTLRFCQQFISAGEKKS